MTLNNELTTTLNETFSHEPGLSPRAIAEQLLEDTRCGLMEDRFDLFRACFALPTRIETFEAARDITTEEELRTLFDAIRRFHGSLGVTHLDRHLVEAGTSGPDRISYTHETRMLNGAYQVVEPYPVFSDAVLEAGEWRLVRSVYAVVDQPRYVAALIGRT